MSRIGNRPIIIPEGVEVLIDGNIVTVKGPKGTLTREKREEIDLKVEGNVINVTRNSEDSFNKGLHGLTRTLISNMVEGTLNGFSKELEINGVGYRAAKEGKTLVLTIGYSHPVRIDEPEGIEIEVEKQTKVVVKGIDKELVGQIAAEIRMKRPPEVYRGKGIKYIDEHIRRKEGKTAK